MKANYVKPKKEKMNQEEFIKTIAKKEYQKMVQSEIDDIVKQVIAVVIYNEYLNTNSDNPKYIKKKLRKKMRDITATFNLIYSKDLPGEKITAFDVVLHLKKYDIDLDNEIHNNLTFINE